VTKTIDGRNGVMKKFIQDFKKFITKGNVLDLAVAVIIGGAFGKIVSSLVNHIIMPVISWIIGGRSFEDIKTIIRPADLITGTTESAIFWGLFIQNVVDFLIIAFVIFLIVRAFARINELAEKARYKLHEEEIKAKEEADRLAAIEAENTPKPPTVEELLTDIKALLEKRAQS